MYYHQQAKSHVIATEREHQRENARHHSAFRQSHRTLQGASDPATDSIDRRTDDRSALLIIVYCMTTAISRLPKKTRFCQPRMQRANAFGRVCVSVSPVQVIHCNSWQPWPSSHYMKTSFLLRRYTSREFESYQDHRSKSRSWEQGAKTWNERNYRYTRVIDRHCCVDSVTVTCFN